jgi:hypothetical protein
LASHAHDREAAASIDQGFPGPPEGRPGDTDEDRINAPRDLRCNARLPNLADLQDKANGRTWRRSATR